jgi:cyclic pyranopterin phosphate synthase
LFFVGGPTRSWENDSMHPINQRPVPSGERPHLIDRFDREVTYVRLSVTDRCDFRCLYCMAEQMEFLPRSEILSLEEIAQVARAFVELGVTKIRLTGGEPLVRKGILGLVREVGGLHGIHELVMTTNGSHLAPVASELQAAGVRRLNVSLDSLKPDRFKALTRVGDLEQVLRGIHAARAAGFESIKLNVVILRNRNHDEVIDFVRFALSHQLDLSFIEEMPLGHVDGRIRAEEYYPSDLIREEIARCFELVPSTHQSGGPARYWQIPGSRTRIGFISPHSHNFCGTCNRVRVTAEGRLLLCLGNEHSVDLRQVLREAPGDLEALKAAIRASMDIKPERHYFDLQAQPIILRHMNRTGG